MIVGRIINKFINIFTGLFGIATVVLMLIIYINNSIPGPLVPVDIVKNIANAKDYCALATVFCAGLEFTLKRNIILAVVFAAIIAAVFAFMTYSNYAV